MAAKTFRRVAATGNEIGGVLVMDGAFMGDWLSGMIAGWEECSGKRA
jgi:hypothetical protein